MKTHQARKAVYAIFEDLRDRRSLKNLFAASEHAIGRIDTDTQNEIFDKWAAIIMKASKSKSAFDKD